MPKPAVYRAPSFVKHAVPSIGGVVQRAIGGVAATPCALAVAAGVGGRWSARADAIGSRVADREPASPAAQAAGAGSAVTTAARELSGLSPGWLPDKVNTDDGAQRNCEQLHFALDSIS